jgi:hypothetical protein
MALEDDKSIRQSSRGVMIHQEGNQRLPFYRDLTPAGGLLRRTPAQALACTLRFGVSQKKESRCIGRVILDVFRQRHQFLVVASKLAAYRGTVIARLLRYYLRRLGSRGHVLSFNAFEMLGEESLALAPNLRMRVELRDVLVFQIIFQD